MNILNNNNSNNKEVESIEYISNILPSPYTTKKKNPLKNINKKLNYYIWIENIPSKVINLEQTTEGYNKTIGDYMKHIYEDNFQILNKKNNNLDAKKSKDENNTNKKKDHRRKQTEKKEINTKDILKEMKNIYKNAIMDNANYVIQNKHLFNIKLNYNDKNIKNMTLKKSRKSVSKLLTKSSFYSLNQKTDNSLNYNNMSDDIDYNTGKYINDKILPQILNKRNVSNKNKNINNLIERAQKDPVMYEYCKDLENKIENKIKLKLSDHYYQLKNRNIKNIFNKLPNNYIISKLNKENSIKEKKKKDNSLYFKNNNNNNKAFENIKAEKDLSSSGIIFKNKYNKQYNELKSNNNVNINNISIKNNINDIEVNYKKIVDSIKSSVDANNINKYINAAIYEKPKIESLNFENQYKKYFKSINSAEEDIIKMYKDNFAKYDNKNDLLLANNFKAETSELNNNLIQDVKKIKEELLLRLKNREKIK